MRPRELTDVLPNLFESRKAVFLWGPPGLGKSSIVRQVAAAADREIVDVRAVLLDPVDLRGLPAINGDGKAHWSPPAFLPDDPDSRAVIFLDELAQAPPLVQSACLQLTLDRRLGEYVMPEGCVIVAASNRQEDRAGAHRIIAPLLNRFVHLSVEVSNDDWRAWALGAGIDSRILSFLAFRPEMLFAFDPKSADTSFPTPRSWEFVSDCIGNLPGERHLFPVVSGCVGEGAAAEFVSFVDLWSKLPDPDQVLASPKTYAIPEEPSVLYALCGALSDKLRSDPKKVAKPYTEYVTRMSTEFSVLAMRDGIAVVPMLTKHPAGAEWLRKNRDVILGD